MALTRHVDVTLARHPPGGKVHYVDDKEADKLPSERGARAPAKSQRARTSAKGARPAKRTARAATKRGDQMRGGPAKKRGRKSAVSTRTVAKAEK